MSSPALVAETESLRDAFGKSLAALATQFPKLVVLETGDDMRPFHTALSGRLISLGLADQNVMAAAGGLAAVGRLPVVTGLAVRCLRAIEQVRLSLCLARRNAKIVASHAGLEAGPEGGAIQALEDFAAFRAMAGMTVLAPADPTEMRLATRAMLDFKGPVYMRAGQGPAPRLFGEDHHFEIGKGQVLRAGGDVTLIACGAQVARALAAADLLAGENIAARVVNMPTIKPIDAALVTRCAQETGAIVTAEDHMVHGGMGSAVAEALAESHPCCVEFVGVRDRFGASGGAEELAEHLGLSAPFIAKAARRAIARKRA